MLKLYSDTCWNKCGCKFFHIWGRIEFYRFKVEISLFAVVFNHMLTLTWSLWPYSPHPAPETGGIKMETSFLNKFSAVSWTLHICFYTSKLLHAYFIYKTRRGGVCSHLWHGDRWSHHVLTVMLKCTDKKNTANVSLSPLRPLALGPLRMQPHWKEGSVAVEHTRRYRWRVAAH